MIEVRVLPYWLLRAVAGNPACASSPSLIGDRLVQAALRGDVFEPAMQFVRDNPVGGVMRIPTEED